MAELERGTQNDEGDDDRRGLGDSPWERAGEGGFGVGHRWPCGERGDGGARRDGMASHESDAAFTEAEQVAGLGVRVGRRCPRRSRAGDVSWRARGSRRRS